MWGEWKEPSTDGTTERSGWVLGSFCLSRLPPCRLVPRLSFIPAAGLGEGSKWKTRDDKTSGWVNDPRPPSHPISLGSFRSFSLRSLPLLSPLDLGCECKVREVTSEPGTNIRRAEVIGAWKRWVRPGTWDNFPFSSLSSRLFPSLHSPAARSERKNDGRERAGMERGGKRRGERRERDKRKRREWPYRSPTSRPSLGSCLTSLTPWGERVKWEKPSGGRERGLRDRQETNRLLVIFPLSTSASLCFAPSLTPHVLRLFSFHSPSVATWGVWAEGREAKHSRAEVARGMGEWRLGGAHPRQLLAALTVSRPRSRHFPSFTHSSHPAAVHLVPFTHSLRSFPSVIGSSLRFFAPPHYRFRLIPYGLSPTALMSDRRYRE